VCCYFISVLDAEFVIVGIFKSVCKILLGIYRRAFTIVRRTIVWYLRNIAMFELFVPLSGGGGGGGGVYDCNIV
jgi:hypothetical protein